MRSLAVALVVSLSWLACNTVDTPVELADCLDPSRCGPGVVPSAPLGRNVPQPDAGAGADVAVPDTGIPPESIPEAGAGPGISGVTGGALPPGSSGELGPVCPALQPTNGAPCDPVANSLPCAYARVTCTCVETWICF